MNKRAKPNDLKTKPADTFGERIPPRPLRPKPADTDERQQPVFRPHDEFGEWLLRDSLYQ